MKIKLGSKPATVASPSPNPPDRMNYPCMYINDTKLPLTGDDIGKTFSAVVKLKVVGIGERSSTSGATRNYDFEVHSIEFKED